MALNSLLTLHSQTGGAWVHGRRYAGEGLGTWGARHRPEPTLGNECAWLPHAAGFHGLPQRPWAPSPVPAQCHLIPASLTKDTL